MTPKPAIPAILCLTPDDFTRQWGTPRSQWVNQSLKNPLEHVEFTMRGGPQGWSMDRVHSDCSMDLGSMFYVRPFTDNNTMQERHAYVHERTLYITIVYIEMGS